MWEAPLAENAPSTAITSDSGLDAIDGDGGDDDDDDDDEGEGDVEGAYDFGMED